jgi:hypothetical protein
MPRAGGRGRAQGAGAAPGPGRPRRGRAAGGPSRSSRGAGPGAARRRGQGAGGGPPRAGEQGEGAGSSPGGEEGGGAGERRRAQGRGRGAREQGKGRARVGGGRRGGRGRERGGGEGSSPRGPNSGDRRLQLLGHHGEREVEEGEGSCCAGDPNEREERGAPGGVWAPGARRVGLGWVGLGHFADRNPRHAQPKQRRTTWLQSRTENRDRTRRTRDIRQRNAPRHDATHITLRFWFIHDTDTVTIRV